MRITKLLFRFSDAKVELSSQTTKHTYVFFNEYVYIFIGFIFIVPKFRNSP